MRCGRDVCPPVPSRRTSSGSAALVSAPAPETDPADVDARVAVEREDPVDAVEHVVGDHVHRTAGHDLLGGLEDQAYAARQLPLLVHLGERESGADQGGRVDVVSAGVGDAGVRLAQGSPVSSSRAARPCRRAGPRAGRCRRGRRRGRSLRGAGPAIPPARPGRGQRGGPGLRPGQLRVRVEVAAQLDQLGAVLLDDAGDDVGGGRGLMDIPRRLVDRAVGFTSGVGRNRTVITAAIEIDSRWMPEPTGLTQPRPARKPGRPPLVARVFTCPASRAGGGPPLRGQARGGCRPS